MGIESVIFWTYLPKRSAQVTIFNAKRVGIVSYSNFNFEVDGYFEHCRWNPQSALIAITPSDESLNFIDPSKGTLIYDKDLTYGKHSGKFNNNQFNL